MSDVYKCQTVFQHKTNNETEEDEDQEEKLPT